MWPKSNLPIAACARECDGGRNAAPAAPMRRRLLTAAGAAVALAGAWPTAVRASVTPAGAALPLRRPARLQPGQTLGLVAPSSAVHESLPVDIAVDTMTALGFKVRLSEHLRARRGHLAGTDAQRAAAVHAMFADPQIDGILALTGGSGANRILPLLDYGLIARSPKFFGGFSDTTALLHAIHARTGLVTFHAPAGVSEWNEFSWRHFKAVAMDGEALLMRHDPDRSGLPAPREDRIQTLRPGVARGPLLGGNLAVLSSITGSRFLRSFDGAILFLEDINEYIYRIDRMLSTLKLAGVMDRLAGVVLGAFTNCKPGEGYGALTLDEVFEDHFGDLGVPVFRGASFGHIKRKFTLPLGVMAEMDAQAGTIRLLEPAVA